MYSRNRSRDMAKLEGIQNEIANLEYQRNNKILTTSEYAAIDRRLNLLRNEERRLRGVLGY